MSQAKCPDGGIGRRARLKLVFLGVWVRFPLRVQKLFRNEGLFFFVDCSIIRFLDCSTLKTGHSKFSFLLLCAKSLEDFFLYLNIRIRSLQEPTINTYFFLFLTLVLLGAVVFLFIRLLKSEKERKASLARFNQLESQIGAMQLENLESRLNPHLFKNILNSIQSHAYQTYFALDKLANVLDYILYESKSKFVTPKEEIAFAMNLIEINKIKISPLFELKVKTKIDETDPLYEQALLAPLISIDLIENAFKHADLQSEDAFISVIIEFKNNTFSLTVSNKISVKSPLKKEKGGLGSETLEQRLRIIYKDDFSLEKFVEENIYIATLKIDLLGHKNKMLTA